MNARFDSKVSNLSQILSKAFENKINKARVNFISLFILALNQAASVNFNKLAKVFDSKAATDSSLRRIQRFMAKYNLDYSLIAWVSMSGICNDYAKNPQNGLWQASYLDKTFI